MQMKHRNSNNSESWFKSSWGEMYPI